MRLSGIVLVAIAGSLMASPVSGAKPPDTWDGLSKVKSKRLDVAYLLPGADFRTYTKVMLDPTEVAFAKNWQRDYNSSGGARISSRVSDRDIEEAIVKGAAESNEIFAESFTKGGYQLVTEPGPDVLRVKTGIIDIRVNAPDVQTAGRAYSFSQEAGQATFFVEVRDALTGALLGRAVDHRYAGEFGHAWRTASSNRDDFRQLVSSWGRDAVRGLGELKALSPVRP